jgi:hypothetical protein
VFIPWDRRLLVISFDGPFRIEPLQREGIFDFGLEDEGSILTLWEVSSLR